MEQRREGMAPPDASHHETRRSTNRAVDDDIDVRRPTPFTGPSGRPLEAASPSSPSAWIASPPRAQRSSRCSVLGEPFQEAGSTFGHEKRRSRDQRSSRSFPQPADPRRPFAMDAEQPRQSGLGEPIVFAVSPPSGSTFVPQVPSPAFHDPDFRPSQQYSPRSPSMLSTTSASPPSTFQSPQFSVIPQSLSGMSRRNSVDPLILSEKGEFGQKRVSAAGSKRWSEDKSRSARNSAATTRQAQKGDRKWLRTCLLCIGMLLIGGGIGAAVGAVVSKEHRDSDKLVSGGDAGTDVSGQSGLGSASEGTSPVVVPSPSTPAQADGSVTYATGYQSLVVFGASYCDNGHARPSRYQGSLRRPPYVGGRWTNGKVWDEYLSALVGPNGTSTTLVNYAYGGATIDNTVTSAPVPDLGQQSSAFLSDLAAKSAGAGNPSGKALVTIWIGINSIQGIWNQALWALQAAKTSQASTAAMTAASANVTSSVNTLFSIASNVSSSSAFTGPKPDFLILPLPPAELLLINQEESHNNNGSLNLVKTLNDAFNQELVAQMAKFNATLSAGQKLFTYDVPTWWEGMYNDPTQHGLTTSTTQCLDPNGKTVCSNPASFLFWDDLHPVTTVHQDLANLLAPLILPPPSSSSSS